MTLHFLVNYIICDSSKILSKPRLAQIFSRALEMYLRVPSHNIEDSMPDGSSLLMQAARAGKKEIVQVLLKRGAKVNENVFLFGINKIGILECLLESLNDRSVDQKQILLNTVLLEIISFHLGNENNGTIIWLLEKGADPNCRNKKGQTPLELAAEREAFKLIKLLLKYKAHVDGYVVEAVPYSSKILEMLQLFYKNLEYCKVLTHLKGHKQQIDMEKTVEQLALKTPLSVDLAQIVTTYLFEDALLCTEFSVERKQNGWIRFSETVDAKKRFRSYFQENQEGLKISKKSKKIDEIGAPPLKRLCRS